MRACTTTSPVPAMQTICTPRFLTNVSSSPRIVLPPSNYSPCLRIALPLHVSRPRIGGDRQISTWSSRLDLSKDLARQRSTVAKVALLFFFFSSPIQVEDRGTHRLTIVFFSFLRKRIERRVESSKVVRWSCLFLLLFLFLAFSTWIVEIEQENLVRDLEEVRTRVTMEILTDEGVCFFVDILWWRWINLKF